MPDNANDMDRRAGILLVGNGINLAFGDRSWKEMIVNELTVSRSSLTYEKIEKIPATMQIVLATGNNVHDRLKAIGKEMEYPSLSEERISFLRGLAALPVDCILTANYGFELEQALGFSGSTAAYRTRLIRTEPMPQSQDRFRLYQYYPVREEKETGAKELWHIHGDIAKPGSMVMGHYYYAKISREIQNRVALLMRRYHGCVNAGVRFLPGSWVDRFMISDVYIFGFGLYPCEADIWWLLCCKRLHFPDTHVYLYPGDMKQDDERALLLKAYGGTVVDEIAPPKSDDFRRYYLETIEHIRKTIG